VDFTRSGLKLMRLDEEKLEELRRWGTGLRQTGGEDYAAAAGRAILMLIAEIDDLRAELANARQEVERVVPAPSGDTAEHLEESLASDLHESVRGPSSSPSDSVAGVASPQSWLESLRRQK
jgi:hypothetical protein